MLHGTLSYREASRARETARTYGSLWGAWARYAEAQGICGLPASTEHVARYLEFRADIGDRLNTIRTRIVAIGMRHTDNGHPDPTKDADIKRLVAGIARTIGESCVQAAGLTARDMEKLRAVARTHRQRVTLAMCYCMRDGLLRRSEAAALGWEDITAEEDGSGRMIVRRSKTDQVQRGEVFYLSGAAMLALAAIRPANASGPLFRMSSQTVARRIFKLCRRVGLIGKYSGHSPRVGMAQDLAASGFGLPELQQAGRWATPNMPARYIRNQLASRGAVAKFHKKEGSDE